MYSVYILRCRGDRLYTGITTDPARRFSEHGGSRRGAKFTRAFSPEAVAAVWETETRSDALRLESRIKQMKRADKERLIRDDDFALLCGGLDSNMYTRTR